MEPTAEEPEEAKVIGEEEETSDEGEEKVE
jgi:hypothetical protein